MLLLCELAKNFPWVVKLASASLHDTTFHRRALHWPPPLPHPEWAAGSTKTEPPPGTGPQEQLYAHEPQNGPERGLPDMAHWQHHGNKQGPLTEATESKILVPWKQMSIHDRWACKCCRKPRGRCCKRQRGPVQGNRLWRFCGNHTPLTPLTMISCWGSRG
jgi:hypothetical protein